MSAEEVESTLTPSVIDIATMLGDSSDATMLRVKGKEDAIEFLQILVSQELNIYRPSEDYLSHLQLTSSNESDHVSEIWRRKLCEWCFEVVDHFGFDREVVSVALNYLDRAVTNHSRQSVNGISKRDFQLFAVTSLYMAIKVHGETEALEGPRQKLRLDAFVQLSRGFFSSEVIEAKEREILASLNWHVNPPTTLKFIATYLRLCPRWQPLNRRVCFANVLGGVFDVARYLTELAVCVSHFSFDYKASVVGYAAVLCAIEALQTTMPLPYAVRVVFLNNVAEATSLVPGDVAVRSACMKLKELCPNMFDGEDVPTEFLVDRGYGYAGHGEEVDGGKSSPVSVTTNHHQQNLNACRKRSRSNSDHCEAVEQARF